MVVIVVPIVHNIGTYGEAFFPCGTIWTELARRDLGMATDAAWPFLWLNRFVQARTSADPDIPEPRIWGVCMYVRGKGVFRAQSGLGCAGDCVRFLRAQHFLFVAAALQRRPRAELRNADDPYEPESVGTLRALPLLLGKSKLQ